MPDHSHRHDRLVQDPVHDPYHSKRKLRDPLVCPSCGVVYHQGRWEWRDHKPHGAEEQACPACRRIADACPAGELVIEGIYAEEHANDIRALILNEAEREAAEHPLNRVMQFARSDGAVTVTTTDIHLPRRLGEALHRAHHGDLSFHYAPGEYFLRVSWVR